MRLKLYRAPGMAEAMARIRAELGVDALILSTRRVPDGVEVTAALEPTDELAAEALPMPGRAPEPLDERGTLLEFHGVPAALARKLRGGSLPALLANTLAFAALPLERGARPLLFTGPPGAGKTLTIARLATRMVMGGGAPVVVTADGTRAGATEQLAAFTRLLGLNLLVASHPAALGRAVARRPDAACVLIDTQGADPFDAAQREEIAGLAATADATVALVLPCGLDPGEAADLAIGFAAAGATLLVATKFDLSRRLGAILAAAHAGSLALAEAGVGPGAADGLAPLTPDFLAARLLAKPAPLHPDRLT